MKHYSFDAVIFDLDGVITKTALVHAKAWKTVFDEYLRLREERDKEPFREFTHDIDYLTYVDGKPRYEGVKSFLESRGIKIPYGDPSDPAGKETFCGIGNKKNKVFLSILKTQPAEVYPSTIKFIRDLKKAGIKVGVISSSKNCKYILESVGVEDLFQSRVDGVVSVELRLKGKPEADIFVKAAYDLGTVPGRAVAVEDAISGVQAGRNGGFGLVVGVARKDNKDQLIQNGADVAMDDISEIDLDWVKQWFYKRPRALFQFWERQDAFQDMPVQIKSGGTRLIINHYYFRNPRSAILSEKKPVFFLDYDGTLTPIVKRPELAVISGEMKNIVKLLSERFTIAVVSGRLREDVEKLVGIKGILYAGSHGFDILGPGISMIEPRAKEAMPIIAEITKKLSKEIGDISGILIEEKKFSVAVHYRLVDERYVPRIKDLVEKTVGNNPSLRLMSGKKVIEILPKINWDKGSAVRWILSALGISWSDVSVIYIGDDTTDEDAFRVVRTRGTGILVSNKSKESAADFQLSSIEEVKRLFEEIVYLFRK